MRIGLCCGIHPMNEVRKGKLVYDVVIELPLGIILLVSITGIPTD